MPDFSFEGSHQFWREYNDPAVYRAICFMETIEDWTLDGYTEVEEALTTLGKVMENISNIDLQAHEKFINLIAYIKTSRTLHILQTLDSAYPGAASKLLMYAEEQSHQNDAAALFLRRNVVFERLRILSKLFSADNLALVQTAIENEQQI